MDGKTEISHVEHRGSSGTVNSTAPTYVDPFAKESPLHKPTGAEIAPHLHPYQEHGPLIDHNVPPMVDVEPANPELWWPRTRAFYQDAFAEFWGVFIIIL